MAAPGGTFGNYVVFHPAALADVLRGPDGPVVRRLIVLGEVVKQGARRRVGVYKPPDGYLGKRRRPGTLRDSIVKRVANEGGEVAVLVGSDDPIALIHHEGTVPHVITARNKPMLVFYWPKVGGIVRFKQVHHPGTHPNRFLTDSLADIRF